MGGGDCAPWSSALSQSSQATSKSVDLTALNSLRLLVRYEFENAPVTTDELVEALGACHNNTLEASHYLRAKRQLAVCAGATAAASAASATAGSVDTSTTTSTTTTSTTTTSDAISTALMSNKRRQDSHTHSDEDNDDVRIIENPNKRLREHSPSQQAVTRSEDVEMPASQRKPNGTTAPPNTQLTPHAIVSAAADANGSATSSQCDNTHEPERVMTSPLQHADESMASADVARARQLIDDALQQQRRRARSDAADMDDDARWVSNVWDALGVTSTPEVAQQLDATCAALAAWLDEVDVHDFVASQKRMALDLVVEIVSMLPRADDSGDLVERVPTESQDDERENDAAVAALAYALEHPDPTQNAHARSEATEATIAELTRMCATRIERIVWLADARALNASNQRSVETQLQQLLARLAAMRERCTADVQASERAVADARRSHQSRAKQLLDCVAARTTELLAGGATAEGAQVQAMLGIVESDDLEVAALRSACNESDRTIAACATSARKAQCELAFVERAATLLTKVHDRRAWFARSALESFDAARAASDARATAALVSCIPVLALALEQYSAFHAVRQARANAEVDEKQRELQRHVEFFGDAAPMNRSEIEARIREYVGVISRSTQALLQIAETQSRVWGVHADALPQAVQDALAAAFQSVWTQLSGPVRDVMQSVVKQLERRSTSESDAGASVQVRSTTVSPTRPAASPAAAVPLPTASITTYSAVTLVDESLSPLRVRSARSSLSPNTTTGLRSVTSSVVKTLVSSVQASPVRVEHRAMAHNVESFLHHAEPVSALFTRANGDETVSRLPNTPLKASDTTTATTTAAAVAAAATTPAAHAPHEFAVGTVVYTKFDVDDGATQFVRGRVDKLLDDGSYSVLYDDGDVFVVAREYIFTQEDMEKDLRLQARKHSDDTRAANGANGAQNGGGGDSTCAIM